MKLKGRDSHLKHYKWPANVRALEAKSSGDEVRSLYSLFKSKLNGCHNGKSPKRKSYKARTKNKYPNGIYIFLYHSVIGHDIRHEYERFFSKVSITTDNFKAQIQHLLEHMTPITFDELTGLNASRITNPYFLITFDDGYENVLRNAFPILDDLDLKPALFVNGSFAAYEKSSYRALQFILQGMGYTDRLVSAFREHYKGRDITVHNIDRIIKNDYEYRVTANLIEDTYREVFSTKQLPRVHLDWQETKILSDNGWEIGNHTYTHAILGKLSYEDQRYEIEFNDNLIKEKGLKHINWLSIPFGRSCDVNEFTLEWLNKNSNYNALFVSGGYNVRPNRTEWLRIGCGNYDVCTFEDLIYKNIRVMSKLGCE